MEPTLTVIIPCYNCAQTLQEAVDSIYRQPFSHTFEVVMVDDCSTDGTRQVMDMIAAVHDNVRCFYHETNKGGGATRNTAIEHSRGTYIFCLDSDDILGKQSLSAMLDYIIEKKCDGVGVSTSIKFKGTNVNDTAFTNQFGYVDEIIPIKSLFENDLCPLYSTFLHTRAAFNIMGGYPTKHGFDTQTFAFRFLLNGLKGMTCPDTVYHHRVAFHDSYYLREYYSGKVNHNWFAIFEEFLFMFTKPVQKLIMAFDPNHPSQILNVQIMKQPVIFDQDKVSLIGPDIKARYQKILEQHNTTDPFDLYWLAYTYLTNGNNEQARIYALKAIDAKCPGIRPYQILKTTGMDITTIASPAVIEQLAALESFKKRGKYAPLWRRVIMKLRQKLNI